MHIIVHTIVEAIVRGARALLAALAVAATPALCQESPLPREITRQLPAGYEVMTSTSSDFDGDGRVDVVVVVRRKNEAAFRTKGVSAPARPLLVFLQRQRGTFTLQARNDVVVFAADQGGQCDPFMDADEGLVAKGAFFTVQHAVACGAHWTDFITFRYSPTQRQFVFHTRIYESLVFNPSNDASAEALIPGKRSVTRANARRPVLLSAYGKNP